MTRREKKAAVRDATSKLDAIKQVVGLTKNVEVKDTLGLLKHYGAREVWGSEAKLLAKTASHRFLATGLCMFVARGELMFTDAKVVRIGGKEGFQIA
jgi:hypothetical protein